MPLGTLLAPAPTAVRLNARAPLRSPASRSHRPRGGAPLPRRPPRSGDARGQRASRSPPSSWRSPPPSTPAEIRRRARPAGVEEPTVLVEEPTSLDALRDPATRAASGRRGAHRPRGRANLPRRPPRIRRRPRTLGVEEPTVLVEEPPSLDARRDPATPADVGRRGAHRPRGGAPLPRRPPRIRRRPRTLGVEEPTVLVEEPPPSTPAEIRRRPPTGGVEEPTVLVEEPPSLDARVRRARAANVARRARR